MIRPHITSIALALSLLGCSVSANPNLADGAAADADYDAEPADLAAPDTRAADAADANADADADAADGPEIVDSSAPFDLVDPSDTALDGDAEADTDPDTAIVPGLDTTPDSLSDAKATEDAAEVAVDTDESPEIATTDTESDTGSACTAADLAATACPSLGVCSGKVYAQCQDGKPACNYAWVINYQATESACDGLDNDCDGQTDWMANAPPLAPLPGVCGLQLLVCGGSAGWKFPNPQNAPSYQANETLCDGLDNDCDGLTDAGLTKPNNKAMGVCATAPQVCALGAWLLPDYSAAGIAFELTETSCDGLDNDCDGETDSFSGPAPSSQLALGVCTGQVLWCAGEQGWQEPDPALIVGYAMGPETTCDGLDNDCDGLTDEDTSCAYWQFGGGASRLALSADGHILAFLSQGGVTLLDTATGSEVGSDLGRSGATLDLALSPSGDTLFSVGSGESVRAIATASTLPGVWPTLQSWTASSSWTAVAVAPGGSDLVAGDAKGTLWWWSSGDPAPLPLPTHTSAVTAVVIAQGQGGTWLVSADASGEVIARAWPAGPAKVLQSLATPVLRLATDKSGRLAIAATGAPGRIYDVASGKLLITLGSSEPAISVRFSADGQTAWSVSATGSVTQWPTPLSGSTASPSALSTIAGPPLPAPGYVADLAIAPAGIFIADRNSGAWRFSSGAWKHMGSGHSAPIRDLSASTGIVLSAGDDGSARRFTFGGGALTPLMGHDGPVLATANWPLGAITAGSDYTLRLWNTANPTIPVNYKTFGLGGPWASDLALVSDFASCWAAAGSAAVRIGLQGNSATKKLQAWATAGPVTRLALRADDAVLAVASVAASSTTTYRALTTTNLSELWTRTDLAGSERALAWVGDRLALAGGPSHLVLVDGQSGATIDELLGHTDEVTALAWHAPSQRLLSASLDGTVRIWSAVPGKPTALLGIWTHHSQSWATTPVRSVAWVSSTSAVLAVSASDDGALMAWSAPQ